MLDSDPLLSAVNLHKSYGKNAAKVEVLRGLMDVWRNDLRYRMSRAKARFKFMIMDDGPEKTLERLQTQLGRTLTPLEGTAPTITCTVSGLPAGATFDPQTAIFNWPTGYSDAGTYAVTFTATNDGDGTGVPLSTTVTAQSGGTMPLRTNGRMIERNPVE